ncbi:hypothetical protein [Paenibacillus methanolicus]|uniref:Uncharacterized protein n=1 Tax=Paenibacillus methanolicus TaxID=582686 RepID=A0A5S5BU35_9BACL|nr:hypothetical protein [Paenibacillus methanolicus]TYP69848.1 hypothetical protein BCM02_113181 [Paenibacillus methanolicus]
MSLLTREWEAKIELIRSIAQSQRAIARILDSVADVAGHSPEMARKVYDNVESMTAFQQTLAEKVAGMRVGKPREGRPGKPLLLHGTVGWHQGEPRPGGDSAGRRGSSQRGGECG